MQTQRYPPPLCPKPLPRLAAAPSTVTVICGYRERQDPVEPGGGVAIVPPPPPAPTAVQPAGAASGAAAQATPVSGVSAAIITAASSPGVAERRRPPPLNNHWTAQGYGYGDWLAPSERRMS